jgi:hypothetical protein
LIRNTRYVNGYGSIFEDVVDPFGFFHEGGVIPHPPSPGEVVGAFTDLIKGTLGGPETPAAGAVGEAGAAASAAGDASVAHHTRDTTTTRSTSTETHQTLTRTFSNPYRDRSLQLRFIPVFRRFEVTTEATPPEVGVAVQTGMVGMAGQPVGQVLAEAVGAASRAEMQRPIARMFQNLNLEGGRVPALSWSQAHPREDSILVPIHDVGSFASSLGMGGDLREQLESSFTGIADLVAGLGRDGRRVDLFMGTHVEPVAGGCVLGDLPALEPDDS